MPRPLARVLREPALAAALLLAGAASAAECGGAAARKAASCAEVPAAVGPADFAILITLHLTAAEMNCPFRIEEGRVRRLLRHHGLSLGDAYTASRSQQLKPEVDKLMTAFSTDIENACLVAWKHFGPGGTFEGFLQPR